jgi:hypothetical protein
LGLKSVSLRLHSFIGHVAYRSIVQHSVSTVKGKVYHSLGSRYERTPVIRTPYSLLLAPLPHVFATRKPTPCFITVDSRSPEPCTFFVSFIIGSTLPANPEIELAAGFQWKAIAVVVRVSKRNGGVVVNMRAGDNVRAIEALSRYVLLVCTTSGTLILYKTCTTSDPAQRSYCWEHPSHLLTRHFVFSFHTLSSLDSDSTT